MSKGTNGGATNNGANFTADDIRKMFEDARTEIREDAKAHDERMKAYGDGTKSLIQESTAAVNSTIEKTGKAIMDTVAADGAETRKTMLLGHKVTNNKLDTLVHRTKTTTGDIVGAIVLGVVGFFGGWNIAAANSNLFINKFGIGVLGFVIGFMIVVALSAFVRGRYEKKSESGESVSAPVETPKPKNGSTTPPAAPVPKEEPKDKPNAADSDQPAK